MQKVFSEGNKNQEAACLKNKEEPVKKIIFYTTLVLILTTTGCSLLKKPMDKRTGFSTELTMLESYINDENWEKATESLSKCMMKWKKVKPWMQLEIDHDVINDIEAKFIELSAYSETEDKADALANTRVIISTWKDIGGK